MPFVLFLYDLAILAGWFFGLIAGAIVFTWLYNSAAGSILIIAVWHGTFNFITASPAGEGLIAAILSTIVMVWAVVIVFLFKPANLSHAEKQISA